MTAGSSFSGATTMFVSLAICAIISYGVFYYFKQRLAIIEQSQMEQARILQAIISRGLAQHAHGQGHPAQQAQQAQQTQQAQAIALTTKEITITQNGLIEVSSDESDSETETDSDSDESHSSQESQESQSSDKWSIGDEIHQPDGYHEAFTENFRKNILLDAICIDSSYVIDNITISVENVDESETQQKKIISLNKDVLTHNEHASDIDNDNDDDDSSSSEDQPPQSQENDNENPAEFELKIGYKPASSTKGMHLNYGNMSVSALRQLAKERGLGGEDGDLQKLKKKDLVQLLQ